MTKRGAGSHWRWNGKPKFIYPTEESCRNAVPLMAPHRRGKRPVPYKCYGWHIGNESTRHVSLGDYPLRNLGDTIRLMERDQP